MKIIFASNNKNKIDEFRSIINNKVYSLEEVGFKKDIDEFGKTFEQNALIKAQEVANFFPNDIIIADDSGLNVDELNNNPGVYSKRYAENHINYLNDINYYNNLKVLDELSNVQDRRAKYSCVLCVYSNKLKLCNFYYGYMHGEIGHKITKGSGFAYDYIFKYKGKYLSLYSQEYKNMHSHRYKAIINLKLSGVLNV